LNKYCKENALNVKFTEFTLKDIAPDILIKQIENNKPDFVLPIGDAATSLVSEKLKIPLIFCMATESNKYAAPPNTGVLLDVSAENKIKIILKAMPNLNSIGILFSADSSKERDELSAVCADRGIKFIDKKIESESEFSDSLDYVLSKSNCFVMMADTKIYYSQTVKLLMLKSGVAKVPVVGLSAMFTQIGALMSVEDDYTNVGEQVGGILGRIINNNEDPGNIKIQKAKKNTFSLNLATAAKLGIQIPQEASKEAFEKF
jgi:ABC-type uncharacterized transport system substrate-binding protein